MTPRAGHPFGTYLTAEESWGAQPQPYGRLFELTNPVTATAGTGTLVHHNAIARVSHEGLAFDKHNNLYYIDEFNGGSVYRYSSATPTNGAHLLQRRRQRGAARGQRQHGQCHRHGQPGSASPTPPAWAWRAASPSPTPTASSRSTAGPPPTPPASRAPTTSGPEDLEIQTLANGDQVLYVATTTTHEVYSLNLATNQMQVFVNRNTIDLATGLAVGSALTNPDNLAIDASGNLYIVEDQPGGQADIWFANDANRDGVAESVSRWATLSTVGAEPSGLYFDVTNPNIAFVNVQHPGSGVDRLIQISAVPEPGTYALLLGGLALLGVARRRTGR